MAVQIKHNDPIKSICSHESKCVCKIVKIIDQRQKEAMLDDCPNIERELGEQTPLVNTRPFILYLPNNEPFSIRISDLCATPNTTTFFRVEEVRDCCALIRGLDCSNGSLICTNYCCWVDLTQFVGVQVFDDVFINIPCP